MDRIDIISPDVSRQESEAAVRAQPLPARRKWTKPGFAVFALNEALQDPVGTDDGTGGADS